MVFCEFKIYKNIIQTKIVTNGVYKEKMIGAVHISQSSSNDSRIKKNQFLSLKDRQD